MATISPSPMSSASSSLSASRIGSCIDAIEYTSGFIATLRDSLEIAANTYDSHLASRLYVCDYIERKLRKVIGDLEYIRGIIQPSQGGDA